MDVSEHLRAVPNMLNVNAPKTSLGLMLWNPRAHPHIHRWTPVKKRTGSSARSSSVLWTPLNYSLLVFLFKSCFSFQHLCNKVDSIVGKNVNKSSITPDENTLLQHKEKSFKYRFTDLARACLVAQNVLRLAVLLLTDLYASYWREIVQTEGWARLCEHHSVGQRGKGEKTAAVRQTIHYCSVSTGGQFGFNEWCWTVHAHVDENREVSL